MLKIYLFFILNLKKTKIDNIIFSLFAFYSCNCKGKNKKGSATLFYSHPQVDWNKEGKNKNFLEKILVYDKLFFCKFNKFGLHTIAKKEDFQFPLGFIGLNENFKSFKHFFVGVAGTGVYILINRQDPKRYYVGSTVNLGRRMQEYINLTKGLRKPQSASELEISQTPGDKWNFIILETCLSQLSLIIEQLALITWKPSINRNLGVVPRVNPQWANLDIVIEEIKSNLSLFKSNTFAYNRFQVLLKTYTIINDMLKNNHFSPKDLLTILVFVYNKLNGDLIVYSSINKVLKALFISYSTLMECIVNQYTLKENVVLLLQPLTSLQISKYSSKILGDNLLRNHILVLNVYEFNSALFVNLRLREEEKCLDFLKQILR